MRRRSDEVLRELRPFLMSGLSLGLGGANVVMQLSRPGVGRGVVESTVEGGSLYHHPVKRTRTTLGYIAIALFGTDAERLYLRREVDRQHRPVHSTAASPVAYCAFDPELQLWVAACMYRGLEDVVTMRYRSIDPSTLDGLYQQCSRFATTLQVPASSWPSDRAAFERYWVRSLSEVKMDEATRSLASSVVSLSFTPAPVRVLLGPAHRFITTGFLPVIFRDELGLTWDPRRQRRFNALCRAAVALNRLLPRPAREFPWNLVLWDTRRRIGRGRPVV